MPVVLGGKAQAGFGDPLGVLWDCHRRIEGFLRVLVKAAELGALDDASFRSLEAALDYFRDAAPRHTADEEESLFPRMRAAGSVLQMLAELEADHARADAMHRRLDALGRGWLAERKLEPEELAEFGRLAGELREIYGRHIAVEDEQVFPLAKRVLDKEQAAAIGQEMAARRGLKNQ
jgi:hemerythrin-like domain-containing protein